MTGYIRSLGCPTASAVPDDGWSTSKAVTCRRT